MSETIQQTVCLRHDLHTLQVVSVVEPRNDHMTLIGLISLKAC